MSPVRRFFGFIVAVGPSTTNRGEDLHWGRMMDGKAMSKCIVIEILCECVDRIEMFQVRTTGEW